MSTFTRETILDRRQPALRWGAVIAGAFVAIAAWLVLQLLGLGVSLLATHGASFHAAGVGAAIWTIIAPLIALLVGGWVAGRLASTFDGRLASLHGAVMWAITGVGALLLVTQLSAHATVDARVGATGMAMTDEGPQITRDQLRELTSSAGALVLGLGVSMLVGLGAAVLGSSLATRGLRRRSEALVVPPPSPLVTPEGVTTTTTHVERGVEQSRDRLDEPRDRFDEPRDRLDEPRDPSDPRYRR